MLATRDGMYKKMDSIIQQLLARGGRLFIMCNEGDEHMKAYQERGCRIIEVSRLRRGGGG